MQSKSLKDISEIIAGYTFRGALKNVSDGKVQVVSAKNVNEDSTIRIDNLIKIQNVPPRTNAFISKNDVLLSSRGVFP